MGGVNKSIVEGERNINNFSWRWNHGIHFNLIRWGVVDYLWAEPTPDCKSCTFSKLLCKKNSFGHIYYFPSASSSLAYTYFGLLELPIEIDSKVELVEILNTLVAGWIVIIGGVNLLIKSDGLFFCLKKLYPLP